jgi:hypothetical protein
MEMTPRTLPSVLRTLTLVLSGATALHTLSMAAFALLAISKPIWILLGFEVVVLVAAVIGIQIGRGRFREGQGLSAICVAGTIAVSSFLAWLTTSKIAMPMPSAPTIIRMYILTRLAVGVWFAMLAAYVVLSRNRESLKFVRDAVLTGVPLVMILGGLVKFQSQFEAWLSSTPGAIQTLVLLALFTLCCTLISLCGHSVIRAFEMGRYPPVSGQS